MTDIAAHEDWTELPASEGFEHDGEPVGSDDDLDPTGYDPHDDPASEAPTGTPTTVDTGERGERRTYPIAKAAIPSWVKRHGNGAIPAADMIKVAPIGSGFLIPEAAAAWRNLQNAASAAGFALTMTGAYRPYEQQEWLFRERYATSDSGRSSKVWNGTRYWLKAGYAMAAVPGTSNHGWGCAVDAALGGYGNAAEPVREPFLSWAVAEARRHGWSWEVQSEPWHLRLVSFDSAMSPTRSDDAKPADAKPSGAAGSPGAGAAEASPPQAPEPPRPTLTRGDVGGQVAALQGVCNLYSWGDCGRTDGRFGPRTEAAVKVMQGVIGVVADGEYGPRSAAALRSFMVALAAPR